MHNRPVKIWTRPTSTTESTCGLTFKLIRVLVELPLERTLANNQEPEIDFFNSDTD